jgi:hypothetical protein
MKRIVFLGLLVLVLHFSIVVGESLFAARVWINRTLAGEDQYTIMCELPEFTNNIARGLGFDPMDAKNIQHEVYNYYCNFIPSNTGG